MVNLAELVQYHITREVFVKLFKPIEDFLFYEREFAKLSIEGVKRIIKF